MTVTTTDVDTARVITWDRQARRNAWDLDTMQEIAAEIEVAGRDPAVRMVAVRGAGGHFSAGDDLYAAIEADSSAWAATIEGFQRMTRVVLAAPVPVVAVVDGVCVGGALEFAASCDLRLCTERVRLITPEVGIGLVASNAGTLLLPGGARRDGRARAPVERRAARRRAGRASMASPPSSSPQQSWTGGSSTGRRSSRGRRATPSRRPSRCSTSASDRSCPPRWSARRTTACGCSKSRTRGPR